MKKKSMILAASLLAIITSLVVSFRKKNPEPDLFRYQIASTWDLPDQLKNTSGIGTINQQKIACITRDKGSIYIYNLKTQNIEKQINFGNSQNYTDIEIVGTTAFILKKEGMLIKLEHYKKDPLITEYQIFNDASRDASGLSYDASSNRLLIAVKDDKFEHKGTKGIYGYSLATNRINFNPDYEIELNSSLFAERKNLKAAQRFLPNAISKNSKETVHILDTRHHELLKVNILNKSAELYKLREEDFPVPETISHLKNNNILVFNNSKKPRLLEIKLK